MLELLADSFEDVDEDDEDRLEGSPNVAFSRVGRISRMKLLIACLDSMMADVEAKLSWI